MYTWQKNVLELWWSSFPRYMAPALRVKIMGRERRHYKSIYGISIWLWVYCIHFFPPFVEILLMYNNTITTDTENDNLSDTLLPQKIYQNPYKLMWLSKYKFPIFQELKQRGILWWHGMLMHICLVFCLQPFVNTSGIRRSNDNRWANFPVFDHIVKFWV